MLSKRLFVSFTSKVFDLNNILCSGFLLFAVFMTVPPVEVSANSSLDYLVEEMGEGDSERTINHLSDLIQEGNSAAMFIVEEFMYSRNKINESFLLLKKSASLGHPMAMNFLGTGYLKEAFGDPDYGQAKMYFDLGASKRNINSLIYLGIIHRDGRGVERDIFEAHKWFSIAGTLKPDSPGDKEPEEFALELESAMDEAAIVQSLKIGQEWIVDNPEVQAPPSIPLIEQNNQSTVTKSPI